MALMMGMMLTANVGAAADETAVLRFNKIRQQTFLIEWGKTRLLIDPWFGKVPARGVLLAPPPALDARAVGRLDLILVSGDAPLNSSELRRLRAQAAYCLVPDESTARTLRHAGYRRVRIVRPGDKVRVLGLTVRVSPASTTTCSDCVGFHIQGRGRSLWHSGPVGPLAVDSAPGRFAQNNPAEVVLTPVSVVGDALSIRTAEPDARLLGELSRARFIIAHSNDIQLTAPFAWMIDALTEAPAHDDNVAYTARLVPVQNGAWYRVARPKRLLEQ